MAFLVGVLFYYSAKLGYILAIPPDMVAAFWPPNTIVLAALLISAKQRWWLFILAMTPAYLYAALESGFSGTRTIIFYIANCTEILVAAFAIRFVTKKPSINFDSFKEMLAFILVAVVIAPFISSSIASSTSFFEPNVNFWTIWTVWFLSDSLAHLTLTPVLVMVLVGITKNRGIVVRELTPSLFIELLLLFITLLTVSLFLLATDSSKTQGFPALLYTPIPILLWAAIRFGTSLVCSSILVITMVAIWNAVQGLGPFQQFPTSDNVLSLQLFIFVMAIPILLLSSLLAERKQAMSSLSKNNKQLILSSRVFQDTDESIMITDDKANIIDINPAFCRITGYTREEVIGQNPGILSSGKQSPTFYRNMWQRIDETGNWQGEVWNRKKGGEIYAEHLTISVIKNEFDKVTNYVGMFTDITKSKLQEEKLDLMAHHDILTGLPNRVLFIDRFSQAVARSKRSKKQLAVCFLDLDNFKRINDQYGHAVGDSLLIEVAKRITDIIREEDTLSRQGGDEFALLLNNIESPANYQQTIERIHSSIAKPFLIDGHSHKITTSSGLTLYPDDNEDLDTLLRHADQAMYQSKLKGKNCNHLFDALYERVTIQKHHELNEIEKAVTNNEFQLYYQPKVNMATGEVFGAEALLRWIHPEKGLIPPLDFLPIIEGTDIEIKVGNWVIEAALAQLESWKQQGIELEISVNVSSYHLTSDGFIEGLRSDLARHTSVDSQFVQLEILESSALGDVNTINSIINDCQEKLGVKAALDDFGTGYSSLTHLRNLPVDTVKIDQSFVRDMLDDPEDYSIIEGIIGLADTFSRNVIAEGIETTNHGLLLLAMGCREAQGYGIAKPMPADDFPLWLESYIPNQEWLQCGSKTLSKKESKVKIYDLYSKHWKDLFTKNIQGSQGDIESWPILDSKKSSCGYWIKEAKKEQLFEEGILILLDKAHKELHEVAQTIHLQFQTINEKVARENLPDYQRAYDKMRLVFEMCY